MKYRFVSLMFAIFIIIALTSCKDYNILGPVDMQSLINSRFTLEIRNLFYKISYYDSEYKKNLITTSFIDTTFSFVNENNSPEPIPAKISGDILTFTSHYFKDKYTYGSKYYTNNISQIKIIFKNGENIIKSIRLFVKNITLDSVYSCGRYYLNTKDEKLIFVLNDLSYSFDGSKYTAGIEGKETLTHISDFDYTYYYDSWTSYSDKGVNTTEKRIYLKDYPPEAGLETKIKFILFVK